MIGSPAARCGIDTELHAALCGKLEGVRQQVLQYLLQPLRVRDDRAIEVGRDLDLEAQMTVLRLVAERPRHGLKQISEDYLFRVNRDRTRLDLRQIEDIGDEVEEIGARAMDRARKLNLPFGEIAVGILL